MLHDVIHEFMREKKNPNRQRVPENAHIKNRITLYLCIVRNVVLPHHHQGV